MLLFGLLLATPLPGARVMFGLARYMVIFFPIYGTLAHWGERPLIHRATLVLMVPLFGLFAALYVGWYFVG